ncbi:MAG TPA: class II fructose-bisphosphate aldolase [Deltaproteobacteria bacterium]|nr:class II fructose-bisphosphate aldolase [Deltaproteobacteria bacterium]
MGDVRPGVVTGEDYRALIEAAKAGGYALAAVNVVGTDSVNAVLEAAAAARSDVILQLSNGGAEFFAGKGYPDADEARVLGAVSAARHVHLVAERYGVCVALHTDHANRGLIPWVEALVGWSEEEHRKTGKSLFSSHMLDLSEETLEENISLCAGMLERMARIDMSLEIELGVTGGEEDGIGEALEEGADNAHLYTQPSDVLAAYEALQSLGHFSVAASFGNVHGVYKPGNVKLRPEILEAAQALVQQTWNTGPRPLNLVFHGGSGSSPEEISRAVSYGVFKMNIDTDTQWAFASAVGGYVRDHDRAFRHQIDPDDGTPYKKVYDPRKWLRVGQQGMITRLQRAFEELGSAGRSIA